MDAFPITQEVVERAREMFKSRVDVRGQDECWPWTGYVRANGYGILRIKNRNYIASRLAILIAGRSLAETEFACHTCDNPTCVNPDHLFAGSALDNWRDCMAKGRARFLRGEANGNSVLTGEDVRFIRESGLSLRALCRELQLPRSTIATARSGRTWGHLS